MRRDPFQASLGPVQHQLGGVGNAQESSKAAGSNPFSGLASGLKSLFTGATNKHTISAPSDLRVNDPSVKQQALTLDDRREMAHVAVDKLAKVSNILTPLLHQTAHDALQHDAFSNALRDLASVVNLLAKATPDAPGPAQLAVRPNVAAQIHLLATSPLANRTTLEEMLTNAQRRHSVLNYAGTRQQIVRFADEVKQIAKAFAHATGDADKVALANSLFPDPEPLEQHLERVNSELAASGDFKNVRNGLSLAGVRHVNINYREDNAFQLSNGKAYNMHPMKLADGKPIGMATSYPKAEHMPDFLRMLDESGATNVVVLASADEIANPDKKMPDYFRTRADWGGYRVSVRTGETSRFGRQEVTAYHLTIRRPDGSTFPMHVEHLRNWADQTTLPPEVLLQYVDDRQSRGLNAHNTVAHCSAGLGRTGVFYAADALNANPNLSAAEVDEAMRRTRSDGMLQTEPQRATTLKMQREVEARSAAAFAALHPEPLYAFQRESYFDPSVPADDEPFYVNAETLQSQPLYENVAALRR